MLSTKWRNPFAKSEGSIAKASTLKPQNRIKDDKKLFFPTFENRKSVMFWVGYVLFFSVYGLAASSVFLNTWWDTWFFFLDLFLTFGFITLFVVGYIYFTSERFVEMPRKQLLQTILGIEIVLVPIATIVTAIVKYILVKVPTSLSDLALFIVINTVMAVAFSALFIYYFYLQYEKVQRYQQRFQHQLMEQNEQLKARITPHFFFNMLNTMQYLIETDPQQAEKLVQDVSILYRASFDDTKEVALLDEIELCQRYLAIEQYRFGEKFNVTWELPDEDLLYDMVISSLTLQLVLEKMIVLVVELTMEVINLNILIEWVNDQVTIEVSVNIPAIAYESITQNLEKNLSFGNQTQILRQYFGKTASIDYDYWVGQVTTYIRYPLKDAAY